jgi:hypothetical protein
MWEASLRGDDLPPSITYRGDKDLNHFYGGEAGSPQWDRSQFISNGICAGGDGTLTLQSCPSTPTIALHGTATCATYTSAANILAGSAH